MYMYKYMYTYAHTHAHTHTYTLTRTRQVSIRREVFTCSNALNVVMFLTAFEDVGNGTGIHSQKSFLYWVYIEKCTRALTFQNVSCRACRIQRSK